MQAAATFDGHMVSGDVCLQLWKDLFKFPPGAMLPAQELRSTLLPFST